MKHQNRAPIHHRIAPSTTAGVAGLLLDSCKHSEVQQESAQGGQASEFAEMALFELRRIRTIRSLRTCKFLKIFICHLNSTFVLDASVWLAGSCGPTVLTARTERPRCDGNQANPLPVGEPLLRRCDFLGRASSRRASNNGPMRCIPAATAHLRSTADVGQ